MSISFETQVEADEIITAGEVAILLKVALPTVYAWVRDGKLRHHRLGRCIRFYKSDVLNWFESNKVVKINSREASARCD